MDLRVHWELHLCRHMNEMLDAQWLCCISTMGFLNNAQILNSSMQLQKKDFRFPRAPSMKSSIAFKFVNNPLHLLVASASIFDAITKAMWMPPAYTVLASFFQAVISCFMASAWSWSLVFNPLYDDALHSSCSAISSLAFSFQAALPFPLCSATIALYAG